MRPSNRDTLVLFTLSYPFGKAESFLENEIKYLSRFFKKVYVFPSVSEGYSRQIPSNVHVLDIPGKMKEFSFKILFKNFSFFLRIICYSIFCSKNRIQYLRHIKSVAHYFVIDISKAEGIKECLDQHKISDAFFYDYWLLNSSLSLISIKEQGVIKGKIIARAHGFDLYDNRHIEGIVPFKEFKIAQLDQLVTISLHGSRYLKSQLNPSLCEKIETHYLGVESPLKIPLASKGNLIVSCSNLIALKRVDLIVKALKNVNHSAKWIHFGGGPELDTIKKLLKELPDFIEVRLAGEVSNQKIHDFYSNNHVELFVSLSENEGLPVSMMEAQSYGIPILGTAINGVPEIVNESTGILAPLNVSANYVASIINRVLNREIIFDRGKIRDHFANHFSAEVNYPKFIEQVMK
ncbi:Glycosyl transferases group 1 [Ekhidna lutea]|uniref:Glycosyl transferases group 1 n=1 Tax=Ekhidna lutea TaxID=447679 RepID=A0A239J7E5_EKHLU|nr:glycosyltransferase [Ekhidna lutea]SNT01936.1 Glycosyl transferases group 1 [Ekhidna lutea]